MKIEELEMFCTYDLLDDNNLELLKNSKKITYINFEEDTVTKKIVGLCFKSDDYDYFENIKIKKQIMLSIEAFSQLILRKIQTENQIKSFNSELEIEFLREVVLNYSKRGV